MTLTKNFGVQGKVFRAVAIVLALYLALGLILASCEEEADSLPYGEACPNMGACDGCDICEFHLLNSVFELVHSLR